MSNKKKIIAFVLAGGALVSIVGLVALWLLLPSNEWIKNNIETKISEATNTQVKFDDISFGLDFPGPIKVVAKNLKVSGASGRENLLIETIEMKPSIMSIIQGRIAISSINLQGVRNRITILSDGSVDYPFVPVPVTMETTKTLEPQQQAQKTHEETQPPSKTTESAQTPSGFSLSIESVRARDVTVEFADLRGSPKQDTTIVFELSNVDLKQSGSPQAFSVDISGKGHVKNKQTALKFSGSGPVKLNKSLDGIETLNFRLNLDHADMAVLTTLKPDLAEFVDKLSLSKSVLNLEYKPTQGPIVSFDGSVLHDSDRTAPLKLKAKANLSDNMAGVESLELGGEAQNTPLAILLQPLNNKAQFSPEGKFSGKFLVKLNETGQLSTVAELQTHNTNIFTDLGIPINNPAINLKVAGTSDEAQIQQLEIQDQIGSLDLAGRIVKPFEENRQLDLKADCLLKSAEKALANFSAPDSLSLKGPIRIEGWLKGALNKASFEMHADANQSAINIYKQLTKAPGKKASLWLKGNFSQSGAPQNPSLGLDAICSLDLNGATLLTSQTSQALNNMNISGKSGLLFTRKNLELKDFDIHLRREGASKPVATIRGSAGGLMTGSLKSVANINANLDTQLVTALGLDNSGTLKIEGPVSINTKVNQSGNSYSFSLESPLKGLDVSYEKLFRKKAGIDGSVSVTGVYSKNLTNLRSVLLSLPGVSLDASGTISDTKNNPSQISLKIAEMDLKKLSSLVPEIADDNLAGKCRAQITLRNEKTNWVPSGDVRLDSVNYRPDKSMVFFDGISGSIKLKGTNLDEINLDGRVKGFVEAPIKLSGQLQNVNAVENISGNLSADMGKGVIRFQNFKGSIAKSQPIVGALGLALLNNPNIASPEFSYIKGDFRISRGVARTDNLKQVGGDLKSAIVGSIDLKNQTVNAILAAKAMVHPPDQLGKIPAVKELVKKSEGLLKIVGLDKELKKLGIDSGDSKPAENQQANSAKVPVNLIFKVAGNTDGPSVTPILENSLDANTANKLKALVN
ncbi:MAG: AsmA-like C-terminal region-containing protein [Desulfomonilaceae bacterium]